MDEHGHLYITSQLQKAMEESGADSGGARVATEEEIARVAVRPGCASLTEDELRHLASLPRKQRRAALAELRRAK